MYVDDATTGRKLTSKDKNKKAIEDVLIKLGKAKLSTEENSIKAAAMKTLENLDAVGVQFRDFRGEKNAVKKLKEVSWYLLWPSILEGSNKCQFSGNGGECGSRQGEWL